jgi:hypothetical protein
VGCQPNDLDPSDVLGVSSVGGTETTVLAEMATLSGWVGVPAKTSVNYVCDNEGMQGSPYFHYSKTFWVHKAPSLVTISS